MWLLRVLNDADEWEPVIGLFASAEAAEAYFYGDMNGFELWSDFETVELVTAQ